MESVLIDTNIALDFMDSGRKLHSQAVRLFGKLEGEGIQQTLCSHAFTSLYQYQRRVCTKKYPSASDWDVAQYLTEYFQGFLEYYALVVPDQFDIKLALNMYETHTDFEDNLTVAIAERTKADAIITNDKKMLWDFPNITLAYSDFNLSKD